jgi:hypothetical protein
MNKFNVAVFLAAMLVVGACAAPRKMLISSETQEMADAVEHQRMLEELETVQALRDRMLAEGPPSSLPGILTLPDKSSPDWNALLPEKLAQ